MFISFRKSSSTDGAGLGFGVSVFFSFRVSRHIITDMRIIVKIAAPPIPAISGRFFIRSKGL